MSAAWVSSSVRLPDFARTTTFRWTLAVAGAFVLYTLVLFGFVYWQTAAYLMHENDLVLTEELRVFAANTPEQRLAEIEPDDVLAHTSLSVLYQKKGMIPEAEAEGAKARVLGWKQQLKKQP